jgi:hypothetical protein
MKRTFAIFAALAAIALVALSCSLPAGPAKSAANQAAVKNQTKVTLTVAKPNYAALKAASAASKKVGAPKFKLPVAAMRAALASAAPKSKAVLRTGLIAKKASLSQSRIVDANSAYMALFAVPVSAGASVTSSTVYNYQTTDGLVSIEPYYVTDSDYWVPDSSSAIFTLSSASGYYEWLHVELYSDPLGQNLLTYGDLKIPALDGTWDGNVGSGLTMVGLPAVLTQEPTTAGVPSTAAGNLSAAPGVTDYYTFTHTPGTTYQYLIMDLEDPTLGNDYDSTLVLYGPDGTKYLNAWDGYYYANTDDYSMDQFSFIQANFMSTAGANSPYLAVYPDGELGSSVAYQYLVAAIPESGFNSPVEVTQASELFGPGTGYWFCLKTTPDTTYTINVAANSGAPYVYCGEDAGEMLGVTGTGEGGLVADGNTYTTYAEPKNPGGVLYFLVMAQDASSTYDVTISLTPTGTGVIVSD